MKNNTSEIIADGHKELNSVLKKWNTYNRFIHGLFSLVCGIVLAELWILVGNSHLADVSILFATGTVLAYFLSRTITKKSISLEEVNISFELSPDKEIDNFTAYINKEILFATRLGRRRVQSRLHSFISPLVLSIMVIFIGGEGFGNQFFANTKNSIASIFRGATITVVQGNNNKSQQIKYHLDSNSKPTIELLEQNIIRINIVASPQSKAPYIKLMDGKTTIQQFQITPMPSSNPDNNFFEVSFNATQTSNLYISSISSTNAIAKIVVKKLPVPKVSFTWVGPKKDPWHDDVPLPLSINVRAHNPLSKVQLLIRIKKRESTELVSRIMVQNKNNFNTLYELIVEPYLEDDVSEVELVAVAIDKASPVPLVGYSLPIRLNVASAYGRYRSTLQTLREIKPFLDGFVEGNFKDTQKSNELIVKAIKQSEDSPFFDSLDRMQLFGFKANIAQISTKQNQLLAMDVSQSFNDFLFEHETIDDRERDRDFFVAVRGLSRLLELPHSERPVTIPIVVNRIKNFLYDRIERWNLRVDRVSDRKTKERWTEIKAKQPFISSFTKISSMDNESKKGSIDSITILSNTVPKYRKWIEELEAAEDTSHKKKEDKRQKNLASAKDQIKELRKRQGQISTKLDKSISRLEEAKSSWGLTKMKQKTNVKSGTALVPMLSSVSPIAGQRLSAAIASMKQTLEYGNKSDFPKAETSSDLAARLLIMANNAASKTQKRRSRRGRKRKRVSGDNYHGKSVSGGDIEINSEYEVNKRYREAILDDIQNSDIEGKNREILDSYLQRVIR